MTKQFKIIVEKHPDGYVARRADDFLEQEKQGHEPR